MAATFDAYSSGFENGGDSEVTVSHTVGSGSDRVLYVIAINTNSSDLLSAGSCTFNGTSLGSPIDTQTAGTSHRAYTWRMTNPPTGTANAVVTASAAAFLHVHVISADGVDQATPNGTIESSGAASQASPISNTVTLSSGGLAVDVVSRRTAGAVLTPGGSQTAMAADLQQGVSTSRSSRLAGSGSTAMSWTFTATSDVLQVAIPINAAASPIELSGTITLDAFALSGVLGLAPGRIDTDPFKNWTGTLLPGVTIPRLTFLLLSDMSTVLQLTNQTTAGDGVLTVTNAALTPGTTYLVVAASVDGASLGAEIYTAT